MCMDDKQLPLAARSMIAVFLGVLVPFGIGHPRLLSLVAENPIRPCDDCHVSNADCITADVMALTDEDTGHPSLWMPRTAAIDIAM